MDSMTGWVLRSKIKAKLMEAADAREAALRLARIGYDRVVGFMAPSLTAWAAAGGAFNTLPVVAHSEVRRRVEKEKDDWTLLDVRSIDEVEEASIEGAEHVYIGGLPAALEDLDSGRHYTVMCASGARATIAASVLLRAGFERVDLFLGSLGAWQRHGYETVS